MKILALTSSNHISNTNSIIEKGKIYETYFNNYPDNKDFYRIKYDKNRALLWKKELFITLKDHRDDMIKKILS